MSRSSQGALWCAASVWKRDRTSAITLVLPGTCLDAKRMLCLIETTTSSLIRFMIVTLKLSHINSKHELARRVAHKRTANTIGTSSLIAILLTDQALGKDPWNRRLPKTAANPDPLASENNRIQFDYVHVLGRQRDTPLKESRISF